MYRFADEVVEITLEKYLAENPDKAVSDFQELKELSDKIYLEQVRAKNAQTKKNIAFDELSETAYSRVHPSPEEQLIEAMIAREEFEKQQQLLEKLRIILDKLTEVQRRRYFRYVVKNMTMREIAALEGVRHQSIVECIAGVEKKIKKILANS